MGRDDAREREEKEKKKQEEKERKKAEKDAKRAAKAEAKGEEPAAGAKMSREQSTKSAFVKARHKLHLFDTPMFRMHQVPRVKERSLQLMLNIRPVQRFVFRAQDQEDEIQRQIQEALENPRSTTGVLMSHPESRDIQISESRRVLFCSQGSLPFTIYSQGSLPRDL